MTEEKRGRGRPRQETTIMPTTLESRQQNIDELIKECRDEEKVAEIGIQSLNDWVDNNRSASDGYYQMRLYSLATQIYVAMIEREPFLANNTDTAESAIRRAKLFLKVWEKEGEYV